METLPVGWPHFWSCLLGRWVIGTTLEVVLMTFYDLWSVRAGTFKSKVIEQKPLFLIGSRTTATIWVAWTLTCLLHWWNLSFGNSPVNGSGKWPWWRFCHWIPSRWRLTGRHSKGGAAMLTERHERWRSKDFHVLPFGHLSFLFKAANILWIHISTNHIYIIIHIHIIYIYDEYV